MISSILSWTSIGLGWMDKKSPRMTIAPAPCPVVSFQGVLEERGVKMGDKHELMLDAKTPSKALNHIIYFVIYFCQWYAQFLPTKKVKDRFLSIKAASQRPPFQAD